MKPGTMKYLGKITKNYRIVAYTSDLYEQPTFFIHKKEQQQDKYNEYLITPEEFELYSEIYNLVFGPLQLTLDLDNV